MSFTSVTYFLFVGISLLIYTIVPKRAKWCVLLGASAVYYVMAAGLRTLWLVAAILIVYGGGLLLGYLNDQGKARRKAAADKEEKKQIRKKYDVKKRAVENCAEAGLAVVLVCCVIPGENDGELGAIVEYAREHMPAVRGVYFQPVSYFGIYPEDKIRRITIPGVIRRVAEQHPDISEADFGPGTCEHPQCSFQACYMRDRQGRLRPLTRFAPHKPESGAVHHVRASLRRTWLPGRTELLTVGGMAFQDGSNIDLMRVRRCTIQIIGRDGTLTPLCSKYLSGCGGSRILPGID